MSAAGDEPDGPPPAAEAIPDWCAKAHEAVGHLVEGLTASGASVCVAESLTGGLLAFLLARQPGSGPSFCGGITAYQTDVKRVVLGVSDGPVVSEQCAREMAEGARRIFGTDLAIALTGVAGPEPQDDRPVGTVHGAVAAPGMTLAREWEFPAGDPDVVRASAAEAAADLARDVLGRVADHLGGPARSAAR